MTDSENRLVVRIAELRAEMMRRFDRVHDDLTVNLARADVAIALAGSPAGALTRLSADLAAGQR